MNSVHTLNREIYTLYTHILLHEVNSIRDKLIYHTYSMHRGIYTVYIIHFEYNTHSISSIHTTFSNITTFKISLFETALRYYSLAKKFYLEESTKKSFKAAQEKVCVCVCVCW